MAKAMKPCERLCPKCGSADVTRRFVRAGEYILPSSAKEADKRSFERHKGCSCSECKGWIRSLGKKLARDTIFHHCRCCQYEWNTAALK